MIEADLAQKFVERIVRYTEYNINIMDEKGYIIASRDPERIGTFHEAAYRIMSGKEDMVTIYGENDYPGAKPGINVALTIDGLRQGVVGVTGDPDKVKSVAQISRVAIEAMLKYEQQQAEILKRQNRKERFLNLLIHEENANPQVLRNAAGLLGYSEKLIRVPILCVLSSENGEEFLKILKAGRLHSSEDISFVLDEWHVLVFKTFHATEGLVFYYKYEIQEYLEDTLKWSEEQEITCRYFVGSFQNIFTQYYYAYQHAVWLESHASSEETCAFFYDYVDSYLHSMIPACEMNHAYKAFEATLEEEFKRRYVEVVGILMQTNWNLAEAARSLYMHKNTLLYHYNKIKDRLDVNPVLSSRDRCFVESFYYYLTSKNGKR